MDVELLYFDGCPNWRVTNRHLDSLAAGRIRRVYQMPNGPAGSPTIEQLREVLIAPMKADSPSAVRG